MGNVLIALDDETEKTLRAIAKRRYGNKKGAITETAREAVKKLAEEDEREKAWDELLDAMKKGYNLGLGPKGVPYRTRDEIYD